MEKGAQFQQVQGGSPWEKIWPVEPECTFPKNGELTEQRTAVTASCLPGKALWMTPGPKSWWSAAKPLG